MGGGIWLCEGERRGLCTPFLKKKLPTVLMCYVLRRETCSTQERMGRGEGDRGLSCGGSIIFGSRLVFSCGSHSFEERKLGAGEDGGSGEERGGGGRSGKNIKRERELQAAHRESSAHTRARASSSLTSSSPPPPFPPLFLPFAHPPFPLFYHTPRSLKQICPLV